MTNSNQLKQTNQNTLTFDDFDKLNLKTFAENLLNNIEQGVTSPIGEQGAYTISLNAEFGNGKTTFLKMFESFIKKEKTNYNILFINAWESDFYGEPIISILSEFINLIKIKEENKKEEDRVNKMLKILGQIANHRATRVIGNIANQVVEKKTGFNLKETIASCNKKNDPQNPSQDNEVIKGKDILTDLNQRKEIIKEIKATISKYTKDKKLIIIVDELDRAKPDHAVRFLEDIKHFFDIENVVFLVAVNRKQMETTVRCLYGQDLNFDGYYRKFFKQEIDLPDPYEKAQKFIDNLIQKTKVKYEEITKDDYIHLDKNAVVQDSYVSCKIFNLTLREIEYFLCTFDKILGNKNKKPKRIDVACYPFFICLFIKEREIFNKILNGDFTVDKFFSFIDKKGLKYNFDGSKNTRFEYKTNLLLGVVAHSFIKDRDCLEQGTKNIKEKFKAIPDARFFINGFTFDYGQPVLAVCERIHECRSVFN